MNDSWTSDCIGNIDHRYIEEANAFTAAKPKRSYFKRVLIKWLIVFLALSVLSYIAFILTHGRCKLVKENNLYYIYLDEKYRPDAEDIENAKNNHEDHSLYFSSVEEMYHALHIGIFTTEELYRLGYSMDEDGKISIFNIENLLTAVFPTDLQNTYISFRPDQYIYCANNERTGTSVKLFTAVDPQSEIFFIGDFISANSISISVDSTDAETLRSEVPFLADRHSKQLLVRYYVLKIDGATYFIQERYNKDFLEIPNQIIVFLRTNENRCCFIEINGCTKLPDIQWLTSFDIERYKP